MAVELATAYVSLVPSFKGAQKAIASELGDSSAVQSAGRRSGMGWVKGASKVLGGAALAAVGATAGVALTKGFSRAIQLQDAEAKLTGLGHSAQSVAKISDNALGAVRGTAFGMGEAMTTAANAVAAGVKPGADLERTLKLVGDAATIAGTDMGSMGAIFNKVAASNKVQMDVINQLHDAGVPALSLLADQMGVTAEEASKMASAGQIDFATFQAAMEKGLGGAAQASGQTFTGSMKNMGAALGRLGAMFATPVVTGAPAVFSAITGAVDSLGTVLKPVAEQFAAWLAPALETVAGWISQIDFTKLFSGMSSGEGTLSNIVALFSPLGEVVKAMLPSLSDLGGVVKQVAGTLGSALGSVLPVIAEAFSSILQAVAPIVPIFADVLADVLPVVAGALSSVAQAVAPLVAMLAGELAKILPIIARALASVAKAIAPLVPVIGQALVTAVQALLPPLIEVAKAVMPVLAQVLGVVLKALTPIIPALLGIVKAFLPLLPVVGDLITALLPVLVSLITALAPVVRTVAGVLAKILVPVFNTVGKLIQWLVAKVITPLVAWISKNLPTAVKAMKVVWDRVWNAVKSTISTVWNWINRWVITPFKLAIEALKVAFQVAKTGISTAWEGVKTSVRTVWAWIRDHVFAPFKLGVAAIQTAFENVKKGIKTAWDGLKAIAAKPVNFILGTVYNDGIREWWNKIAGAVGLNSLKLPRATEVKFASGGVLPGYTPGRDVHSFYSPTGGRLALSGGEAIMRPEWTRAVGGPRAVAAMNSAAKRGQAFKNGGVWDNIKNIAGDTWDGIKAVGKGIWDAGAMAVEVLRDPVGAIKKAVVDGILKPQMEKQGFAGNFITMLAELPAKFAGGLGEKVKQMLGASAEPGGPGSWSGKGLGWARMWQLISAAFPNARLHSAFRPGAITAVGTPSMHGIGRAVDVTPSMEIFNWIKRNYPNSKEIIYSPAGGAQVYKGKPFFYPEPTRSMHFDHIHWGYANGGVVPKLYDQGGWIPDGGMAVNLSGKPEAVLDPEESAALKNGLGLGPLVGTMITSNPQEAVDELERMRRRAMVSARMGVRR